MKLALSKTHSIHLQTTEAKSCSFDAMRRLEISQQIYDHGDLTIFSLECLSIEIQRSIQVGDGLTLIKGWRSFDAPPPPWAL